MRCILNGKEINIYPCFLKKLGKGTEGKVYKYKDKALKLYYDSYFSITGHIGPNECEYLSQIDTKRILLPKDILQNRNYEFKGYTEELIVPTGEDIYQIDKSKLLEELYALREEIKILSQNFIRVDDWIPVNFMYDGMFRFVDSGQYKVDWYQIYGNRSQSEIQEWNDYTLTRFIIDYVIYPKWGTGTMRDSYRFYQNFSTMYQKKYSSIEEYFENTMTDTDTLGDYISQIKIK